MSARPCVTPLSKDFRFVLSREGGSSGGEELVTAGGLVEAKWAVEGETWKCLKRNILVSQDSGDGVVIVQRTQNCIYNEWKGFSWWTLDLQAFLSDPCRNKNPHLQEHDGSQWPAADYVVVNMDGQGIGYLLPQYSPTAAD